MTANVTTAQTKEAQTMTTTAESQASHVAADHLLDLKGRVGTNQAVDPMTGTVTVTETAIGTETNAWSCIESSSRSAIEAKCDKNGNKWSRFLLPSTLRPNSSSNLIFYLIDILSNILMI